MVSVTVMSIRRSQATCVQPPTLPRSNVASLRPPWRRPVGSWRRPARSSFPLAPGCCCCRGRVSRFHTDESAPYFVWHGENVYRGANIGAEQPLRSCVSSDPHAPYPMTHTHVTVSQPPGQSI